MNLRDEAAVRRAFGRIRNRCTRKGRRRSISWASPCSRWSRVDGYELILGSSIDPQFGPVLLFGAGGQLVEVFKDRALALPPLNTTLARRMMEQTKIFTALQGVRGRKPVPLAELEQLLVRFSQLVVEQPWIKEIDINPLLASPERLVALDARVLVHGPGMRPRICRGPPSGPIRCNTSNLEGQGRNSADDPADPAGRRADDGGVPRATFRA